MCEATVSYMNVLNYERLHIKTLVNQRKMTVQHVRNIFTTNNLKLAPYKCDTYNQYYCQLTIGLLLVC